MHRKADTLESWWPLSFELIISTHSFGHVPKVGAIGVIGVPPKVGAIGVIGLWSHIGRCHGRLWQICPPVPG